MHIQPEARVEANNKVLTAYIEGGEPLETPMRSAGLTGAGEIIGVVDTGLDDSSCFFKDEVNGVVPRCVCVCVCLCVCVCVGVFCLDWRRPR